MELEEYLEKKAALQRHLEESAKSMVTNFFEGLFKSFPVERAKWSQYTPYFNDGDSCVFHIGDLDLLPVDADEDTADSYEEGYMYCANWGNDKRYNGKEPNPSYKPAFEGIREWLGTFSQLEDALELCFGDHVQIEVVRKESGELDFSVDSYEHD